MVKATTAIFLVQRPKPSVSVRIPPLSRAFSATGTQEVTFHCFVQRIWRIR
jgi:hypothetical protein